MSDDFMDGWLTEGGLDEQPVTLRNARFDTDLTRIDDAGNPATFLAVDLCPDNPDVTTLEDQRFGIGKGWDVEDDGARVVRDDGKKAQYNKASKAGRFVDSLLGLKEFREAIKARHAAGDQVTPFDAAFFEGLKFVVKANEGHFKAGDGEEVSFRFFTASEFLGFEGQGAKTKTPPKPAKKAASKKAAAKKAAAVPVEEPEEETMPAPSDLGDLRADLVEACKATEASDHGEWMVEMYETFADRLTTDEAMALVDDETAIWAEVWN
jgi:hypothetical protein